MSREEFEDRVYGSLIRGTIGYAVRGKEKRGIEFKNGVFKMGDEYCSIEYLRREVKDDDRLKNVKSKTEFTIYIVGKLGKIMWE